MKDDEAKKIILARRARFIAAAMVGAGAAAGCDRCNPLVCLEPAPGVCLKVAVVSDAGPPEDAASIGPPTPTEAGATIGPPPGGAKK